MIDTEVQQLLKNSYDEAIHLLTENRNKLDILAKELYERENLTGDEFMTVLNSIDSSEQSDDSSDDSNEETNE